MKYEIFFYGSVFVEADDKEEAVAKATEYLNENASNYTEIREVKSD